MVKKEQTKDKSYIWKAILIIIMVLATVYLLLNLSDFIERTKTTIPINYYQYECDGELLDDECSRASIREGGVYIKGCKSGNEYFCQSAKEIVK